MKWQFRIEKSISKIKILTEWVNSKVEITEEGVSKLKDQYKLSSLSNREKIDWEKKMSTASGACGKITKDLTLMSLKY